MKLQLSLTPSPTGAFHLIYTDPQNRRHRIVELRDSTLPGFAFAVTETQELLHLANTGPHNITVEPAE